jgi:hypothetical protein
MGWRAASLLAAEHSHHRCRCARLSYGMCTLSPLAKAGGWKAPNAVALLLLPTTRGGSAWRRAEVRGP